MVLNKVCYGDRAVVADGLMCQSIILYFAQKKSGGWVDGLELGDKAVLRIAYSIKNTVVTCGPRLGHVCIKALPFHLQGKSRLFPLRCRWRC